MDGFQHADPRDVESRILVVDDHRSSIVLTRRILQQAGYGRVRSASDPRDALTLARTWQPDLVLVDLHMPHIGGSEFIVKMRGNKSELPTPVLVITGDDSPEALARARRCGASDCLIKPIDAHVLLETVGANLARRRDDQDNSQTTDNTM